MLSVDRAIAVGCALLDGEWGAERLIDEFDGWIFLSHENEAVFALCLLSCVGFGRDGIAFFFIDGALCFFVMVEVGGSCLVGREVLVLGESPDKFLFMFAMNSAYAFCNVVK